MCKFIVLKPPGQTCAMHAALHSFLLLIMAIAKANGQKEMMECVNCSVAWHFMHLLAV